MICLPSLNQVITGLGVPVAGHGKLTLLFSMIVMLVGVVSGIEGGSDNGIMFIASHYLEKCTFDDLQAVKVTWIKCLTQKLVL